MSGPSSRPPRRRTCGHEAELAPPCGPELRVLPPRGPIATRPPTTVRWPPGWRRGTRWPAWSNHGATGAGIFQLVEDSRKRRAGRAGQRLIPLAVDSSIPFAIGETGGQLAGTDLMPARQQPRIRCSRLQHGTCGGFSTSLPFNGLPVAEWVLIEQLHGSINDYNIRQP